MNRTMPEYGEEDDATVVAEDDASSSEMSMEADAIRAQLSAMKEVKPFDEKKFLSLSARLRDVELKRRIKRLEKELDELRSGEGDVYLGI